MSDINAAHLACMQRLSNGGETDNHTNEESGGDGDSNVDRAEHFMKQYFENRQRQREEQKRMQKVMVAIIIMMIKNHSITMIIQEKKAAAAKQRGKTGGHTTPGLKSGEAGQVEAGDGVFESCDHDIACSIRIGL